MPEHNLKKYNLMCCVLYIVLCNRQNQVCTRPPAGRRRGRATPNYHEQYRLHPGGKKPERKFLHSTLLGH